MLALNSLFILLNIHTLWAHQNSGFMGHHEHYIQMRWPEKWASILCSSPLLTPMLHCPTKLHFIKYKFKDKIVKHFKTATPEHEIEGGDLLIKGPLRLSRLHTLMKPALTYWIFWQKYFSVHSAAYNLLT